MKLTIRLLLGILFVLSGFINVYAASFVKEFSMYDFSFSYPQDMELNVAGLPGLGENKFFGRIIGLSTDHIIVCVWFKQPFELDINEIMKKVFEHISTIGLNVPEIPDVSRKTTVQNHDVTYFLITGKYEDYEGTGILSFWRCGRSSREFVFIVLSHEINHSENLFSQYLDGFNCHTGNAIPGCPLVSIFLGLLLGIYLFTRAQT